jgi:hypothetical protein
MCPCLLGGMMSAGARPRQPKLRTIYRALVRWPTPNRRQIAFIRGNFCTLAAAAAAELHLLPRAASESPARGSPQDRDPCVRGGPHRRRSAASCPAQLVPRRPVLGAHRFQARRDHPHVGHRGHEVHIPAPARHQMRVQMLGDATAIYQLFATALPLRWAWGAQRLHHRGRHDIRGHLDPVRGLHRDVHDWRHVLPGRRHVLCGHGRRGACGSRGTMKEE